MSGAPPSRPRVVIVGGGFAGAYCARTLERRLGDGVDVLLLDTQNYFVFFPLLVEAGTGGLEPRHTVVSLRAFLRRTRFVQARLVDVDTAARRVLAVPAGQSRPRAFAYDQLVLALGSVTLMPRIPGLAEHGLPMKNLADAVRLRNRAIARLEAAQNETDPRRRRALLHFVVVGASLSGVEVAGELHDFLRRATGRRARFVGRDEFTVTLVEREPTILGVLDPALAADAQRLLTRRGIRVRTSTSLAELRAEAVLLDDGTRLDAHTLVWCAGIAAPALLASLPLPRDSHGYLDCTPDLRVAGSERVWAVGDCARNPDASGRPAPATAQHAVQQGRHLARNLARALAGEPLVDYRPRSRGTLAALGGRSAVAEVFGVRLSGFLAWWLWRSVYLLKMPGIGRKLRVALDWTMDLLFRPEIVHLDMNPPVLPPTDLEPPETRPAARGRAGSAP